ncbi:Transcriptional regulator EFH1 [Candida viswanathii]|uniref:Transcriptional regulator EFH1 n=1 Tax=Candida viswanathii TaxID=5486 RepID=A0A367YP48_9ASCO|nr:Transcriptional regulator EFH1 [Candida viswanathii]
MNEIMTASRHSNFYSQDLVGASSSSDHITVPPSNQQQDQTQQSQANQQATSNGQLLQQSPQQQQVQAPQVQPQSQPLPLQQHHQQLQQQPQQQTATSSTQDIPPNYPPYTSSYQQTRVPKNFLLENTSYYTIQPGFPLVQTADYYAGTNATADYLNSLNQIISPSFQMSSVSTPDTQNTHHRSKSQVHPSYQQQQQQMLQHHQQVQELFNTPGAAASAYIPVKQTKTVAAKTDQPPLIQDKFHQQIATDSGIQQQTQLTPQQQQQQQQQSQQPYSNPAFMLYSQQGVSSSAPVSTSSSSSVLGTANSNQATTQPFQFAYGSPPTALTGSQMYSFQRQPQHPQQVLSMPIRNTLISSAPGGPIATTPTMATKSRNSSLSRASTETGGERQSRATSISSCIPQNEYPERVVRPKVATTRWDDENTNCYQVRARNILVSRREDSNYINGTKLLNVIGMTRGKRDGILKTEKIKNVVKVGSMNLKGVWIPFDRAYEIARNEGVDGLLYPLFVKDIKEYFLTKGHKLKSEDDEQQLLAQQQDIEEDDESTSISSSKNSENKLLETSDVIKSIEDGTTGAGITAAGSGANHPGMVGDVKYVHDYFQRSPQANALKDEELYYGSTQNTPLSVPKTL